MNIHNPAFLRSAATEETLILVDERNRKTGEGEKLAVHREGKLHRAFSIFLFDGSGRVLLQRRSIAKYHSGGLWANTCCGHPRAGEQTLPAAHRRLGEELGASAPSPTASAPATRRRSTMGLPRTSWSMSMAAASTDACRSTRTR